MGSQHVPLYNMIGDDYPVCFQPKAQADIMGETAQPPNPLPPNFGQFLHALLYQHQSCRSKAMNAAAVHSRDSQITEDLLKPPIELQ